MRFEINIARQEDFNRYDGGKHPRWVHYAKVTLAQSMTEAEAIEAASLFQHRFAGMKITLMRWEESGRDIAFMDDGQWHSDDDNPAFKVPDDKAAKIAAASYDMQTLDIARD